MYYHRHEQKINIPQEAAAPRQSRGCSNANGQKKQTILVGAAYHRRLPPSDTTTTNLLLKELAIDP